MPDRPKHFPFDSPLRWKVESRTNSHECYVVDLGMPACQCRFWQCDVGPKLRKGLTPRYCTHYYMAKERFANWAIWEFERHDLNKQHDQEQLQ